MNHTLTEIGLPKDFIEKMKHLLGEEFPSFLESFDKKRVYGLRVNALKLSPGDFPPLSPFTLKPIPWAEEGYYYEEGERPGKHPWHEAGLYYLQEPSAMAAAKLLDPKPGERILDLCAAPGGKSTHIAALLKGEGFLLSNEIHKARVKILSRNVERMGIAGAVVSCEDSRSLALRFPAFFDRIAVDAPCSGEGMFRKDEAARQEWSLEQVTACALRQKEILANAASMLKPGGRMLYSTCTFSPEENEQVIEEFLSVHSDFSIEPGLNRPGLDRGRPQWSKTGRQDLADTFRIWPHKAEGEGHYFAVLKKSGEACPSKAGKQKPTVWLKDKAVEKAWKDFLAELFTQPPSGLLRKEYLLFGEQLYLLPSEMPDCKGFKLSRPGLHLGTIRKNRFEPSHALALFLKKEEVKQWVDLAADGEEVRKYLKGETLSAECLTSLSGKKGWFLVNAGGYSIGFAKLSGGILKNHYPKGLRSV